MSGLKLPAATDTRLSACKTLPFGLGDLASGKGKRLLKKLDSQLNEWPDEELALCIGHEKLSPPSGMLSCQMQALRNAEEYCRIEAEYFLNQPEKYHCDCTGYGDGTSGGAHEKKLLLFYPAEPCRRASEHFSTRTPDRLQWYSAAPLLHLSKFTGETQVILELENNYMLLTVSKDGRMEKLFMPGGKKPGRDRILHHQGTC